MKNKILNLAASLAMLALLSQAALSQAVQFGADLALAIGIARDTITVGVSGDGPGGAINDNTYGLDPAGAIFGPFGRYGENLAPPGDPDGNRVRVVDIPGRTAIGPGMFRYDYRGFTSSTQIDTFAARIDGLRVETEGLTVSWANDLSTRGTSWILYSRAGATLTQVANMLTSTSHTFAATGGNIQFVVIKTGVVVQNPGPTFVLSPTSLAFGNVSVGGSASQTVSVNNSGSTNALSITGATLPAGYSIAPSAFPISVAAGATQNFTVTFAPTSAGDFSGNIAFAHNAPTSPTNLAVSGTGVQVVPVSFVLSPTSLNFGSVPNGGSASLPVTVSNGGTTTSLVISSATLPAMYSVSPALPVTIAPGTSQVFTVTYAPTVAGTHSGNIAFTHNAPGSPSNLAVTGVGTAQGGTLQFAAASRQRLDHSYNHADSLQLVYGGSPLKAIQYWVVLKGLLRVRSVERGASIADSSRYGFAYNLVRGPLAADSSSNDTIKTVIYGVGNNTLPSGTNANMMKFAYDVANITDSVRTTSIDLIRVFSSLSDGTPAGVTSGGPQQITILNKTYAFRGDVNGDDRIDILDLLLIVDHIIERQLLTGRSFTRADVYQWPNGDGVVNVQGLALLQNMILTGQYPDGTPFRPVGGGSILATKTSSRIQDRARLTFHVTTSGIVVRMVNHVAVRGLQVRFDRVASAPESLAISTLLGQGFHSFANGSLRVLMYNQSGYTILEPGDRLVARMPFSIANPAELRLSGELVLADANNNRIDSVEASISLEPTSVSGNELPTDFALDQNYPNPFNPSTTIRFQVPSTSTVKLAVYNALGQEVRTLFLGEMNQGVKSVVFDGKDNNGNQLSSGMYLYRMTAGSFVSSKKLMFLK